MELFMEPSHQMRERPAATWGVPHGGRMLDEHSPEHTRTLGTCQLPQDTVNTK